MSRPAGKTFIGTLVRCLGCTQRVTVWVMCASSTYGLCDDQEHYSLGEYDITPGGPALRSAATHSALSLPDPCIVRTFIPKRQVRLS